MSLREIQEQMREAVLSNDVKPLQKFLSSKEDRTEVYTFGYRHRLFDGLKSDYPLMLSWLGEAVFEEVAEEFVTQQPATVESLGEYNGTFPKFVEIFFESSENKELLKTFPWAIELAEWEWLPLKSFAHYLPAESGLELNPEQPWKLRQGLFISTSEWNFFDKKPRQEKTFSATFTKNGRTQQVPLSEDEARWLRFFSEPHTVEEFLEFVENPVVPTPESITMFFTNCSRFEWLINS